MTTQNPIDAAKQVLRTDMARRRGTLSLDDRTAAAEVIAKTGIGFASPISGMIVSGYAAIGDELSPLPLLKELSASGHPVALPVIYRKGAPLFFREWLPGTPLERGPFSVPVPGEHAAVLNPEILLVPLLAFDMDGFRLGYGAGYYDRTLSGLRAKSQITAIGLAFDEQRLETVPHDKYDEALDWVLTPSGPIRVRAH
jgi:5-formyltetrahydrofolate cyclo-ligase